MLNQTLRFDLEGTARAAAVVGVRNQSINRFEFTIKAVFVSNVIETSPHRRLIHAAALARRR